MTRKAVSYLLCTLCIIVLAGLLGFWNPFEKKKKNPPDYDKMRIQMVNQIESMGIRDKAVLNAMKKVPRHLFVPTSILERAYNDCPLPIGYGQTISQPYIVALMTELLKLDKNDRVLEIGTGSGYQAAILAEIAKEVYSIEIVDELYKRSASTLKALKYNNIRTEFGDGYNGWKENSPYDAIIVTAAAEFVPPPLLEQLKVDGRLCIPVGPPFRVQDLVLIEKKNTDKFETQIITQVLFVPLTRKK